MVQMLLAEGMLLCSLFWAFCWLGTGSDEKNIRNFSTYPDEVQKIVKARPELSGNIRQRGPAAIFAGNLLLFTALLFAMGLLTRQEYFAGNFLNTLLLGQALNLFDFLVIDLLWWRHTKRVRFSGTEESPELYADPRKHFYAFLRGVLLLFRRVYPTAAFTVSSGKLFTYRYYQNPQAKATLVLLTGGIGLSDLFYKHFARFARDFSVLTFDYQLQFGDNGEFADAVAELLRHLKEKVWLVGQSLGGVVAQVIASRHPEVVEGLVLSNTCSLSGNMSKAGYQDLMKIIESQRKFKKWPAEVQKMACLPAVSAHQADDEMGGDEKENRWLYSPGKGRYGGTVRRYDGTAHQAL